MESVFYNNVVQNITFKGKLCGQYKHINSMDCHGYRPVEMYRYKTKEIKLDREKINSQSNTMIQVNP